jgi:preprotein translocase SecE subunit
MFRFTDQNITEQSEDEQRSAQCKYQCEALIGEIMAEKAKKNRQLKKTETVRERAGRTTNGPQKPRKMRRASSAIITPFKAVWRIAAKALRPLAFLLTPFKTRPMRFIGRVIASILLFRFFRDAWKELRQVQWPNARETVRLSIAVFVFSILFGILIATVDYGLDKVFRKVFID